MRFFDYTKPWQGVKIGGAGLLTFALSAEFSRYSSFFKLLMLLGFFMLIFGMVGHFVWMSNDVKKWKEDIGKKREISSKGVTTSNSDNSDEK